MTAVKKFSDFNIQAPEKKFVGDKIKASKILGEKIVVHDFSIEDSKHFKDRGNGKCLKMQITYKNEKRVVFTGSQGLMKTIQDVPKDGLPFTTTIIEKEEFYEFS